MSASQGNEAVEADNRRLIQVSRNPHFFTYNLTFAMHLQENYTLTQANQMLHERVTMLLKRATSASDSNKVRNFSRIIVD